MSEESRMTADSMTICPRLFISWLGACLGAVLAAPGVIGCIVLQSPLACLAGVACRVGGRSEIA
jgi:hypothetical protein